MFKGYTGFGGVELINVARLVKYAKEGAAPEDLRIDPKVGDYSDLAAALGDPAYRTVLLDAPPWYDATNPDSAQFAGLLPLEITGLDGSTRGRDVTEGLEDGGNATRSRANSRTIGVTALAIASTDAALDAGLSWLTGVLHPPCATGSETCRGAELSLFSAAPLYCDQTPNLDADPVVVSLIGGEITVPGPSLSFYDLYFTYLDPVCGEVTVSATVRIADDDDADPYGRVIQLDLVDSTGTVFASGQTDVPSDGDTVTITVSVEPSPGFPAQWQPVLTWFGPAIIDGGDSEGLIFDFLDGGGSSPTPDLVDAGDTDGPWGTGGAYGGDFTIEAWTFTRYPILTPDDCLSELRRSFRNVVTVSGPTVVEELTLDDGTPYAARVEWTWVATDPIVYGDTEDLLRGLLVGVPASSQYPVYLASTGNVALYRPPGSTLTIDGYSPPAGVDYPFLLKDQTDPAENGVYYYIGPGATLQRPSQFDTWADVVGAEVVVSGGTVNEETAWASDAAGGGTLGVTPYHWASTAIEPPTVGYDNRVEYRAAGIQIADNAEVDGTDTACPAPSPVIVLCGDDPSLPPVIAPPVAPTLPDPGMPTVDTYVRREFQIPPEQSPQPGGVLTFVFNHLGGEAYRGIRVRLWADQDPDFGVADECDWETEFYLSYLAPSQAVTIDGPDHTVTTTCVGGIDADHERNMRGPYGGPFSFPQLRCGERYHVAIDVPVTEDAGGLSVDLAVTRRGV